MEKTIVVTLAKVARKAGGDRYEDSNPDFVTYIPQYISRPEGGTPLENIEITFRSQE